MRCMKNEFALTSESAALLSRLTLFVLTLHFYVTPLCSVPPQPPPPSPAHTHLLYWTLRWPSGRHFCFLTLPARQEMQAIPFSYLISCQSFTSIYFILFFCTMRRLLEFVFSLQILLRLTQVSSQLCVCVCVSTFPEPCPSNQRTAHQEHGKNRWWIWTSKRHQLEDNQGLRGQKGKKTRKEKHFSFHGHLRRRFSCGRFHGIEADRLLRAQWGTYNLLGE